MELQTVKIEVSKQVKQFIISSNQGSEVLIPSKNSVIWGLLKQHLACNKDNYSYQRDNDNTIQIAIRNVQSSKNYNYNDKRIVSLNVISRGSLTPAGERIISRMLDKEFKKTFEDYMKGCLNNNLDITIKGAIEEFCTDHNIDSDMATYEMLKKHWYRFKKKYSDCVNCSVNY